MDTVEMQFAQLLRDKGIAINGRQLEQFAVYYRELVEWNGKMNLTGITEREQVYTKHFFDSVSLAFYVPIEEVDSLADIGSGAGFPGIPLKIVFPHLQLTIVDSLNKRIQFLHHLAECLGLTGVTFLHGRAEELGRSPELRDRFDLVTARAVARLNVLNEFCLPFVKPGGWFAAMKGADPTEEIAEAAFSVKELRAESAGVHSFELPVEQSARHIVLLKKTGPTPGKYPRKPGSPIKTPLLGRT